MKKIECFIKPLQRAKRLARKGFGTFDTETKDGLQGKRLFCWSLTIPLEKTEKIEILSGKDKSMHALFAYFEQNAKQKDEMQQKRTTQRKNKRGKLITIKPPIEKLIIYCHNLGFDERFIRKECIKRNIEFFLVRSGASILALDLTELHVRFIDTFQYFHTSQEEVEIEYKVPENLRKIDCKDLFNKDYRSWSNADKERMLEHNKNDVQALHFIMKEFRKAVFEVGNVDILSKISISAIAMTGWRKMLHVPIFNPFVYLQYDSNNRLKAHKNEDMETFVRKGYFGGRCEVFNTNRVQNAQYWDKVSMYGDVMFRNKYPIGQAFWSENSEFLLKCIETEDIFGFCECKVDYPIIDQYPVLPSRMDKKVVWDCKAKTGVWALVELREALRRGYQLQPTKGLLFEGGAFIFDEYIGTMFELKRTNKGAKKDAAKRFINHLYGKFAQRMDIKNYESMYFKSELEAIKHLETLEQQQIRHLGYAKMIDLELWQVLEQIPSQSVKPFQNIAIAAYITAYARLELAKAIDVLAEQDITIYYCDTDSITVQNMAQPPKNIVFGENLGNWQIEHEFREVQFFAPKLYAWVEPNNSVNIKLKGLDKRTRIENLMLCEDLDDIEGVFKDREIVSDEIYCGIGMSARKHAVLVSAKKRKTFSFINDKRVFDENGESIPYI